MAIPCRPDALARTATDTGAIVMRTSYLPRDQASGFTLNDHDAAADRIAARRARNRRHFFITVGVLAVFIIARLVLRFFFPGAL